MALQPLVEAAVGRQVGQIEKRRAETSVIPVDQPEPRAVVQDVARQQVVVTEDQRNIPDCRFQLLGYLQQLRQIAKVTALTLFERAAVVAQHMKRPKGERRAAKGARHLPVHLLQQRHEAVEHGGGAQVRLPQGAPFDEAHHQHPPLGVDHFRRDAGLRRRAAGRGLVEPHDMMDGNVVAQAHHVALGAVDHMEIHVGDTAFQRLGIDRTGPQRQGPHPRLQGIQIPRRHQPPSSSKLPLREFAASTVPPQLPAGDQSERPRTIRRPVAPRQKALARLCLPVMIRRVAFSVASSLSKPPWVVLSDSNLIEAGSFRARIVVRPLLGWALPMIR